MNGDPTWTGADDSVPPLNPGFLGWALILVRGVILGLLVVVGMLVLLFLRLVERPIFGTARPWSGYVPQIVSRCAFAVFGIGYQSHGARMTHPGAVVSNHSSWMDILALNAGKRVYFVAKSEVSKWPGIGGLARATGTVFIERNARHAAAQKQVFEDRLTAGHKLLFFPEGTSTDGLRVLPFKPTLFAAFFSDALRDILWVQPVSIVYTAPKDAPRQFYGWWGDMDFGAHMLKILAAPKQGAVEVIWHPPLEVAAFADRKALAKAAENAVRSAVPEVAQDIASIN